MLNEQQYLEMSYILLTESSKVLVIFSNKT